MGGGDANYNPTFGRWVLVHNYDAGWDAFEIHSYKRATLAVSPLSGLLNFTETDISPTDYQSEDYGIEAGIARFNGGSKDINVRN